MALIERTEIGKIEILPNGVIQIRVDTVIERDGKEISRLYHRPPVLEPEHQTDHIADTRIKAVAAVVWTKDVVDARKQALAELRRQDADAEPAPNTGKRPV
jgi:hypothetical protein